MIKIDNVPPKVQEGIDREAGRMVITHLGKQKADAFLRGKTSPISILTDAEVEGRTPPEWWVEGLLQQSTVAVFAGEAGIGKSFMMLHMARCVATGTQFFHHKVVKGRVLYVVAEGAASFGKRISAWDDYHGVKPARGSIGYIEQGVNLSDIESVANLIEQMEEFKPDLIVLDTLSQLAAVDNENDAAQLAAVFRTAKELRDVRPGSTVVLVHHVNKGAGGVRGSSVIRSNADTVILAKRSGSGFLLTTEISQDGKQKDGVPVTLEGFQLQDHLSSAVIVRTASARVVDPDLDAIRSLSGGFTKREAQVLCGHPRADNSDSGYQAWNRKWKKWTDPKQAIIIPSGDGFALLDIAS